MGCSQGSINGIVYNASNTEIRISISSQILSLQEKNVETNIGGNIQANSTSIPGLNINGQYKTVSKFQGKQIKSLIILKPKTYSCVGMNAEKNDRLNVWIEKAGQIKQVLLRDVKIKHFSDLRFKVLPDLSYVSLTEDEYTHMVNGNFVVPKCQSWSGYYSQRGEKFPMNFSNFTVSAGGLIFGAGNDEVGDFTIKGHVNGEIFNFVKSYIDQHKIFYTGEINTQLLQLKGFWGFHEDQCEEHFQIKKD